MSTELDELKWIDDEKNMMISLVEKWANINSHSENPEGLNKMIQTLHSDFSSLQPDELTLLPLPPRSIIGSKGIRIEIPSGKALLLKKRSKSPFQAFLGGHMDTVYPTTSLFQNCKYLDSNILRGPGVTDMKGGLVILLKTLEAFERSQWASKVGWEVIINPDEEVGSVSSKQLFVAAAKRNQIGLIFEPSFTDGAFVSERKGSANFTFIVQGKSAHAGRDFHNGKSAIYAIAHLIYEIEKLHEQFPNVSMNIGQIEGGQALNIVPELAICKLNIRGHSVKELSQTKEQLNQIVKKIHQRDGIQVTLIEDRSAPPKLLDEKTKKLFSHLKKCTDMLKLPFLLRESGGVCDGNTLSYAGLPTLDSLGGIGGKIHTDEEYLVLSSLVERAKLTTLFLIFLAKGEILPPKES